MSTYDDDDGALLTTGHGKTQCELFCADQPGDFIILQQLMEDSSAGGYSWNCSRCQHRVAAKIAKCAAVYLCIEWRDSLIMRQNVFVQ